MPKYKVNGKTYNIPDNEVDLFEADFPEAQLHYQTNDGKRFTIFANERKDFLSDFPDAQELGWESTVKEKAKEVDPFSPESNLAQPLYGSMSYQDNIGSPADSLYYPSPLSEEGRADYEPITAEERSKQEYDMLMRQLDEFNATNGNMMDTYEAYEKAAKHQVNEGGFAIDTPERRYLDEMSSDYHARKMERDELNERIKNNAYFNQMRMAEADAANETVDAISNLMAQNEAENTELHKKMQAMNALAMNPRGSFSGFAKTKEMQEYMDERADLETAKRLYQNTAQVYAAPINDGEDIFKKFGQGFGQRVDDADFWSMGIIGIADDMNARAAFQKIQDKFGSVKEFANLTDAEIDALLTPSEQLLISAVMDNNAALYARKDNTAGAYEAGAGAADSLMFMAQFLLTGGIGDAATVGTAAHRRLVNWLGRKVGSMSNGLMKDVARGAVKLGVGTAESIGKALVMTPLMPHTYANIADKMMSFDDNGELMDTTDAIISGSIDALIETWSESTGDFVNKILGVPGDITKGVAKKVLKNVDFSDWGKAMNAPMMKILKKGGFNGFLGEMGEEFIGNATRSLVGTLAPGSGQDPEALKNFAKWEQLLVTAGSFAPMTIFGIGTSSAQYGLAKRKLANAQSAFESMLRNASYTEDQIRFTVDELLGSTDAHLTPEKLIRNFSPLLEELQFNDKFANNRTQALNSAVDFIWQIARYRTFDGIYHRQEEQQRNDMLAEIQEGTGREFWTTRLSENAGLDGTAYETNEVRAVEFNDGRVAYVLGSDGTTNTVVYNDGQTGFLSEEQLAEGKANGSIVSDATMGLNDYLTQQVARVRMTEEEQRMFAERNTNIGQVRAQFPIDATVELGTTEAPIQGVVRQQTPNGVIVESPAGVSMLTWEELGRTIGVEVNPQTDAQMEEEAINNLEIADLQRRREREQRRAQRNTQAEAALEAEQMLDEAENEGLEKPIPMKADGTVDQTAFWNESPARWAQWKTEQRQDGGAYASSYIQNAIGILEGQIAESEAAFLAESDFDAKDALEQTINQQRARLAELQDLALQYMPSVIPAETSTEAAEETSPAAQVMAERQKFELDAEYQRRLSLAKTLAEKEMILKEYFEAISAGSMEAVVMNKKNYKQIMKENGCDETAIEMVTNAIKFAEEENKAVDALHVNDKIFVIAEYISSVEDGRVSYVHERQHNITKKRPEFIQRILSLGLSREALQNIVKTLSGSEFYNKNNDDVLADEILSFTMEIGYTFDDFSVTLSKLGLPIELINILNEINDEQRKDFTLVNARRSANALDSRQRDGGQDDNNQREVSGGILGQEGVRLDENSERGTEAGESGEAATGGAEASEEGLQVPLAEVGEEEPTDEDALTEQGFEVDEQNEDVRFSVRFLPTPEQRKGIIDSIINVTGRTRDEAERWLASELSLASIVLNDKEYLDYAPDSKYKAIKDNSDYPQGTVDFNNICRKRKDFTQMYTRLQRSYPNRIFTAEDLADIRTIMSEDGLVVACGLCYVEDRRQKLGEVADEFIKDLQDGFKAYGKKNATKRANAEKFLALVGEDTYVPTIYDLITLEGSDRLHDEHRGIWEAFGAYNRARGQQTQNTFQGYAEYKREILTWSDAKVKKVNSLGGLRIFSYSDFEAHHLLDIIQIIIDCAARGVMIQGYTKVPEFARVVEKTGIKLNRSLIPLGDTGIVYGKLAYDPVEGIDINDPNFLESNDNVGNILIGINDEQIRMAMADPFIHYIIPYHARQAGNIRAKLNVGAWTNYIDTQNERKMSDGKRVEKNINIYTDVLNESITNDTEFVERYLEVCREKGYIPKFDQFLNRDAEGNYVYTPGYYKFLVDFKLFDEAGNILPQKPVVAQFDDAFNAQVLNDYAREERETAGAAMNSTYDKIVETLDLGEPTEGEDIRFSVKDSEGPIDLVEEARKADNRHRIASERTLVPGHVKGQPILSDAKMLSDVSFRISKNTRRTIEDWCDRAGLAEDIKEGFIDHLEYTFDDTTEQLCAAKWYLNGTINLPNEDEYKVRDAVKVAKQNKVDALLYYSPMDILEKFGAPKEKLKPINPDKVSTLKNKTEVPGTDITIYDVEESEESRKNMREIINTHYGKNASPWCLLQGDVYGNLSAMSAEFWKRYSAYPKQVAFKNGKLLAFSANSSRTKTWWDRMDIPHSGVPVVEKLNDAQNRRCTIEIDPKSGKELRRSNIYSNVNKDGYTIRRSWNEVDGPLISAQKLKDNQMVAQFNIFSRDDFANDVQYLFYGRPNGIDMVYTPEKSMAFYENGELESYSVEGFRAYYARNSRKAWTITTRGSIIQEYSFNRQGKLIEFFDGQRLIKDRKALAQVEVPSEYMDIVRRNPKSFMAEAEQLLVETGLAEAYEESQNEVSFRITAEQDKAYMDAVKAGDMETAQRMVIEAARLAMPNTKVVDKYGNPKIVMHLSSDEFTKFGEGINTNVVHSLGFFTDELEGLQDYHDKFFPEGFAYKCFLNFENPEVVDFKGQPYWSYKDESTGEELTTDLIAARTKREGKHDGLIMLNVGDELAGNIGDVINDFVPFIPSQIKSAEPVTYDDEGNVIPLSERFNPENEDIRFRTTRTNEQREQLFENAKNHYGLTNNFNASGYMLPDGSLLDFSEANDGGDPNRRSLDHRDIEGIIMDEGREYDSRYQYVTDFVNEGAIRMLPEYAGFQLSQAPTAEQRSKLMDYIYKYNGEVIMEITDENGGPRVYMEYNKRTSPARIFKDMDGYFNEGEVPGLPPIRFRVTEDQRDEVQFRAVSDALYEEMDDMIESLARTSFFNRVEGEFDLGKKVKNFAEFADLITIIKNNDDYIATGSSLLGFFSSHTDQHFPLLLSNEDKALRKQAEINLKEALSQIDDTYVLYFIKDAWKAHKNGLAQAGLGVKPSATTKFNKAIDARIEEIKAGRVKGTSFNFKKGEVSLDEVDALFKQLNTNEELAVLHDKVMDLAKRFDIKPQFAAIRGAAEGESLGDKVRYDYRAFNSAAISDERKANIITHELIHSVTSYAFFLDDYMPSALTPEMREAIAILRDVYSAIRRDNAFKDEYGASSVEEMVAELSNTAFREKLKEKSLYQRILDAILKLFGVVKEDSAYNAANEALTYIIENYDENAFNLYSRHAARSQEYAKWYNPEDVRFRMSNDNQAIFVSNAARAVEGIKQEKATPEQWLKMIEKAGGLKAGEDKWMGLSDWLKASDKKTLTKQEVLDYINENMIIIEEQHYSDEEVAASAHKELNDKYPGWEDAFSMEWDTYMDEPYASIWDNETAVELYNDTHEDQIELDEDGEFENLDDESKVMDFGKELAEIFYRGNSDVRPIHGTRSDYQTRGLSDNHEIALTVPNIERWKADDAVHFGDAGDGRAIAWIRFGETKYRPAGIADEIAALDKAILEYEGETSDEEYKALVEKKHSILRASRAQKVLVIDEIQSNRHQEGRKRGYKPDWREMKRLRENLEQADREVERIEAEIVAKYGSLDNVTSAQDFDTLKAAMEARREARLELNNPRYGAIPDAPFEKNWAELAMKRMLRYAAENGFDIIAWTTGDQQANRYDLSRDVIKINAYRPNAEGERIVSIYYRDEYNDYKTLTVDKEGKVVQGDYNGSALADVVGKEMALQIMNAEDVTEFKGDGLKIGGEGMRGFYDKMLPAFMNKYGKKWGVTVEDINLPNLGKSGYTMHSVPVTEEMKASVMEGQVMFRTTAITPEVQDEMNAIHASAIVMGNFMKAPNGKDTNLTEEQWLMVRTKNFRDWFGDWLNDPENASKVVDENGEPKVVFHGGAWRPLLEEKGNAVFKMRSGLMGRGAYFTDNFTTAADYAREKYEWENYQEVDEDFVYDNGYITEAFLNIRNEDDIREYYGETFYLATSPNQIKSAIDNNGEFSEGEGDIRFKVVTDPAKIEELESGEKIKVYRAMQLIDGKLYPPMSAKVDGQLREPIELGQWEEAEERPDLADNKGYFKLDKGNKKSLKARYNPYFHTSYTPLNDQFSEAQDRPNLVTVEVEIPVSELTSGYKADKAKDSVGEKEWKAGVIQGKLSGTRKVILSRWDKPIRIVPDSEVADVIVKMFEGKDIVMPSNVVTPSLRAELESRGVPFVETDNQGKKLTNIAEMTTPIWSSKGTFANLAEAEEWAHKNLQGKSRVNRYTGERISIGSNSISKMLSPKAQKQSSSISAHLAALKSVLDFIKTGIPAEVHADQEGRDFNVLRLYNAIEIDNKLYRVKSTVRKVRQGDKFYTYEVQEMELIEERWSSQKGEADNPRNPDSPINSITGAKLLKGVKKSNSNENILPESENVSFRVNENPTEAQKEAGNYKMGHLNLDGYRITIENPKGSVRRGTDSKGNAWENTLNNDYGYIRGTEGVDGDHIDVYLSDNPSEGNVFVIDQVNPQTREFDEHKVMYGFNSAEEAREAYLANFSEGWNGLGTITEVSKDEFKKWIQSSHRKTKPFSEYKSVKAIGAQSEGEEMEDYLLSSTGTPTEDVVAEGVSLSPAQLASLAGDIFAALPEERRKKITDGLNGNILGLQDAILQIPTSLATKEEWNDEDKQMAQVVAEQMTKMVGKEMTRPFSASEALWTLYNAVNKSTDLVSEASRALVRRNLGFDSQTLEMEQKAKDDVRFRTVGDASANAQASMYNRGAANVWTRLKEVYVDMHASVEELVKSIEKKSGKVSEGFENILMALNQQSSKGLAAMEAYEQNFLNKMFDEIRNIMDKTDFKYDDIVRYVILKHGLERNIKLAQRDAKAHYQEIYDDIIAKIKGMNPAQKRTYLTNAQLRDADAKAELARLQAVNTSVLTPDQLRDHKKELAKAKKEATEAAEHLVRAQKIATFTEQDALDELDKIFKKIEKGTDSVYKEMRKNDYSGISSMFYDTLGVNRKDYETEEEYQSALMQAKADKYDTLGDIEGAAQMEVTLFENLVNTDNLWKSINKATKETLRQQYEANMISKDQYDNLRNMFEFYVPLRGFKDNTAEDMYTYYRRPNSTGYTKPILGAEGRKTEAESPFGWIAAMAGSAIASNVKNEAKLALYYFVANRPYNGVATLSRTWFVHTPGDVDANGKKIFRPAYPPFNEDLSTDAAKQAYEDWQEQMRDLQKQGLAYEAGQRLNLGNAVVNISDTNKPEHIVNVKVGGKDYTIVINGNPRAAQAINGDLNIESTAQDYSTVFGPLLRWMSSVNTSYNPEFWITNMMRDMAFTMMAVSIKEDPAYRRKFKKNYLKAFKVISMVAKNEKGTLGNEYIENMYKDFVKYGGVTGYTQIKDSETWEKEIENYLASNDPASLRNGKVMRGMKSAFHAAHRFGESLEQVSRFAAFLTAVETGKSINEAINDAKEITVNFNRKGSGKMITLEEAKYLTDRNGQPLNKFEQWMVVGLSSIAPLGRRFIMFFNAAIQGLNATYQLWKKNKLRSIGWVSGYVAIGALNAVLHAIMDDDDDYLDIPQYERRNSLMIGGNGAYFKWALPQEARAFYALGDLAVESFMGRNPHQSALAEALKISTEILPINPSEGWKAFMPSIAIPFVELALNEDYKGAPIYNEQKWLTEEEKKRSTKWSKAYSGTGKIYIDIAKALNAATGGDKHDAGLVNLQPEKIEHIVQSAFGGTIRTADKFINTIMAAIDPEEDITVRQFPFLNRILTINDERYKNVHVNDVYDYYAAEAEHVISLQKQYTKDRNSDALKDLKSSDEYKWATIYSRYKKTIKKYQEKIKAADTTNERMELMKQQDELKRKMIKEISEL